MIPDILFKGIPRSTTRGYTAQVIALTKPSTVVIPCCGSFALASVVTGTGMAPEAVICGDISLYSSILGAAITGQPLAVTVRDHPLADLIAPYWSDDPLDQAAAVLLVARILQYERPRKKRFHEHHQRELQTNAPVYVQQLRDQIRDLHTQLHGLTYVARDLWDTLEQYRHDPSALLLVNPPRYTGGYDRMFAGLEQVFDWPAPDIPQFVEHDYPRLMDLLGQSEAHSLVYYATQGEDPATGWGDPWHSVFADLPGSLGKVAINWIVSNRPTAHTAINRTKFYTGEARFKLFDGDIGPESVLTALRVTKPVGDYYRDLFIHKLAGSSTEVYTVLLIDGRLMAVIGVHLKDFRRGARMRKGDAQYAKVASVTFAFTVPHDRYDRLHKLTLMSAVSSWYWESILGSEPAYEVLGNPVAVATVMLTPHPENKTARGVLRLVDREATPDGFKLRYIGDVITRTAEETLALWLHKFSPTKST